MRVLDQFCLDGRVAIVTGGSRGLGRAMARALVEAGARVALASRNGEEAAAAAADVADGAGAARGYACDVTSPEAIEALVESVQRDFGPVSILVNNAGISTLKPIEEQSLAEFQQVILTNLTGPWLLCKTLAPQLKASGSGRVINIGSTVSVIGYPGLSAYASSKGGLLQLTRTLALEWGPAGVTVNCILPGAFAHESNNLSALQQDPQAYQNFINHIPLRRWGVPEDLAGLVVYLASDASRFMTGAAIMIDGGQTAQ